MLVTNEKIGRVGVTKFRKIKGRKKDGDEILLVKTDGEEAVTMRDLAVMVVHKYLNEELLYPRPQFRGGEMLIQFLRDCIKNPNQIDVIASKYELTKGVKLKLHHFM